MDAPQDDDLDALDRLSPYDGDAPQGTVVAAIPVSLEDDEVRVITREGGAMMASTQVGPLPENVHGSIEFDDASGPPYRVAKTVTVIGRVGSAADLVLPWNEEASRQHCAILYSQGGFFLEDLQSSNGTYLNEEPVERVRLCSGDKIRIGTQVLVFRFKM
jgi:pSer/pThr/pTyr-binding forkhead associated (FHA) protein